jgi:sugar lactone lactonase YvrE
MWITRARWALAFVLATGTAASAQPVMKTAVGQGETIAVAYDPGSGTVYYAGDRPGAIYRQTNPYAGVLVAGLPGGSLADGIPAVQAAVFPGRNGLAVDAGGNLFFSEPALHRIRRIDAATGLVTTIAGAGGDVPIDSKFFEGNNAIFNNLAAPGALAFNPVTGDLFVADETLDIVYRITGNGSPITSSNGFMYRAVGGNPANTSIYVEFEWYNPYGYAGDGGPAKDAKLNHPRGLAFDNSGDLYIADTGNNVVRRVDASSNVITTIAGNGVPGFAGDGGLAASAELFMPTGVGVLEDRTLYIADTSNHRVRAYDLFSGGIDTFAGDGVARFADNSYAFPTGIAAGSGLTFFVVDSQNRSLAESDLTSDSALKIEVAHLGDPSDPGYVGDGAAGGDAVNQPMAVVFDKNGNAFFSDSGNSRVRRVDAATNAVTTVVGNGIPGYDGDNGDALHARLNCPAGLAFGAAGDLFVSDTCANVVRHVSPGADGLITGALDEIITTAAGTGVRYGTSDGQGHPATAARLNAPGTLAIQNGTLFVGEPNVATIASIVPDGTIHYDLTDIEANAFTVDSQGHFILADAADSRDIQCDGQEIAFLGGSITAWGGAAVDSSGRLYLTANAPAQVVYRFQAHGGGSFCSASSSGTDQLALAGTGSIGYSGDNGPAASATLNQPAGLAVDAGSNIWIADTGNNAIRRVQQPSINVTASPASLDFGTQAVQTTSTPRPATATSSGTSPATFSATTLGGANPGDFVVVSDGCVGAVVASGAKCQVSVAFRPTAPGSRSATLQFNDNATGSPQTITLTGSGATLDVSPSAIAFDPQTQSIASSAIQVTVTNRGTSPVSILSLSFTGQNPGDFSVAGDGCTNVSLNGGGSCTFGVVFTPQGLGSRMATLTITSSASDLMRSVNVTGTGTPPVASAAIAPAIVAFGQAAVGTRSTPVSITVTSTGTAALTITSAALTGNQKTDFILSNDSCSGATLAPSQTCTVSVAFAPADVCNSTAAVTFTDNAPDSPQNVSLSGRGVTPGAGSPFHAVVYCTSPAAQPQELAAGPDGNVWFDEHGSIFSPAAIAQANAAAGVIKEDPTVVQNQWRPSSLSIASDGSYAYIETRGGGFDQWYDIVNPQGVKIQQPIGFPGPSGVGPDDGFWLTTRSTCADNLLFQHFAPNAGTASVVPATRPSILQREPKTLCLAPSFVATGPDGLGGSASNQGRTSVRAPNVRARHAGQRDCRTSRAPMLRRWPRRSGPMATCGPWWRTSALRRAASSNSRPAS